ncbi:MAG: DUF29 domain-containing protein [Geminicoccaceae bacterium]|nr:DUF29 domain-containing protein [Geminicoccaceae bacterium]MDW8371952.1 DUF29 domain-containing protein [Geminicoccaceae bacterium]
MSARSRAASAWSRSRPGCPIRLGRRIRATRSGSPRPPSRSPSLTSRRPAGSSAELYERDFYAWTRAQVRALKKLAATRPNLELDLPHLIEEVEDLGKSERDTVRAQLRRILVHLLKLRFSPAREPRPGWVATVADARAELADKRTPTLERHLRRELPAIYERAALQARRELEAYGEAAAAARLPATCPWPFEELVEDVWPEPEAGG